MSLFHSDSQQSDPDIDRLWKEVAALEAKGQPRAALAIVDEIIDLAQAKDLRPDWIKGYQFKANLIENLEESGSIKALEFLQEEAARELPDEIKALTYTTLAERVQFYLRNQFYRLNNRTNVSGDRPKDISAWGPAHFEEASMEYFTKALSFKNTLVDIPVKDYELIIDEGKNTMHLTPSLYEFIAHKYLEKLTSGENYAIEAIAKPISWNDYLISSTDFMDLSFNESKNRDVLALNLFKELLIYSNQSNNDDAIIYNDLKRIQFIYGKTQTEEKDELYEQLLNDLKEKFNKSSELALVHHALASHYLSLASKETDKPAAGALRIRAHDIFTEGVKENENGYGVEQCKNALQTLELPQLGFQIESTVIADKPILIRINHKGLSNVRMRIGSLTREQLIRYHQDYKYRQNYKAIVNDGKIKVDESISLIDNKNYTTYSTEKILKELQSGIYFLFLEDAQADIAAFQIFHASQIGFATNGRGRSSAEVITFDRVTGKPLAGVQVRLFDRGNRGKSTMNQPIMTGITNSDGIYIFKNITSRSFYAEFVYNGEAYFPFQNIYAGNYRDRRSRDAATLLTDRAIYRPGQKLYYKAILYAVSPEEIPTLLPNKTVFVEFLNTHGKVVSKKELVSNGFGSVNGSFDIPDSGLNGAYTLRIAGMGYHSVRVEEYKRPKFNVELSVPEGKLTGDMVIEVPGLAKSFAGTALENVTVKYEVKRSKQFPYYYRRWGYFGNNNQRGDQLVAVGETTTDADGNFIIPFESVIEDDKSMRWRPIYVYEITADVTDENGETRTGTTTIRVGSESYYIKTDILPTMDIDVFRSFVVSSQNAMGEPAESDIQLTIQRLVRPAQPTLNRKWDQVDYVPTPQRKFLNDFPYYAYDQERDISTWKTDKTVFSKKLSLNGDETIELIKPLDIGAYKVTATDQDGNEKYTLHFTTSSFDQNSMISDEQLNTLLNQEKYAVGDELKLMLHSPFKNSQVLVQIEKQREIISERWYDLSKTQVVTVPVVEADRGGFVIHVIHTVHNHVATRTIHVDVPWANKKLDITWETFRDKLIPGQEEKWKLKITGPDKEKVTAEILASMYDASLDEFVPFQWSMNLFPTYRSLQNLRTGTFGLAQGNNVLFPNRRFESNFQRSFPSWRYIGQYYGGRFLDESIELSSAPRGVMRMKNQSADMEMDAAAKPESEGAAPPVDDGSGGADEVKKNFAPRTNLNETVFFMPELMTDEEGNVILEFTMNEALTSWKLQLLGHTQSLQSVIETKEIVTQKDLMIFPQIPRFMREGDKVTLSAKINKLVNTSINGSAWIEIKDAQTGEDLTSQLVNDSSVKFEMSEEKQKAVDFLVDVPQGFIRPLEIIVRAKAGKHTDGESNVVPVLTNQILVTETMPMSVRANQSKDFTFEALSKLNQNNLTPHNLTLEYMENPVWFAVQSLPYLKDYPHTCTEQVAHKIYANAIASHIIKQFPKIEEIFSKWESKDELISNLSKNQELKSALIEETPWLLEAESEAEQMKNIARLFDFSRMSADLNKQMDILLQRQMSNGAWPWFSGGRGNVYITQLVVEIFGHLNALGVEVPRMNEWDYPIRQAISYSHKEMRERYDRLTPKQKKGIYLDATSLHAIYITSFFMDKNIDTNFAAWKFYYSNAKSEWVDYSLFNQALLATAFYRFDEKPVTEAIVTSFKDRALRSDELGMYWKLNTGYYWYNQPIETHAHIMEAISLIDENNADLNEARIWLLKHKQTNRWRSTVSTAKAIYALLLRGDDWLGTTKPQYVQIGDEILSTPEKPFDGAQAGTGYFKKSWEADEINSDMATISIRNENEIVSWGAAYWQYFQAIDEVEKYNDNPLKVERSVFQKVRTTTGEELVEVDQKALTVGDKVTVRLELSVDRMMEFIHLKDLRAAGFEPVDVLSGYQWDDGLSYYQSTTDLGTHFFIDYIQQGTYVIEYDAFAVNAGDFSGGMATLQCMYAPEFASHSEGRRIEVER